LFAHKYILICLLKGVVEKFKNPHKENNKCLILVNHYKVFCVYLNMANKPIRLPKVKRVSVSVWEIDHGGVKFYAKQGTSPETFALGEKARRKGVRIEKPVFNKLLGLSDYKDVGPRGIVVYYGHGESIGKRFNLASAREKTQILNQILDIVAHMHKQGFTHGDLNNPDHFVIDKEGKITLLDLEARLAKEVNIDWTSPQSIIKNLYDDLIELNSLFENLGLDKKTIFMLFRRLLEKYNLERNLHAFLLRFIAKTIIKISDY